MTPPKQEAQASKLQQLKHEMKKVWFVYIGEGWVCYQEKPEHFDKHKLKMELVHTEAYDRLERKIEIYERGLKGLKEYLGDLTFSPDPYAPTIVNVYIEPLFSEAEKV